MTESGFRPIKHSILMVTRRRPLFLPEEMMHLLSTAHSACAHYLAPSLRNRKHASKLCVLTFNRSIVVYLLLLHALVVTTTCAELDKLISFDGAGATLSMVMLGTRPLIHQYLRLVMGPANAVAPPSTHGGKPATINKPVGGPPRGTPPIPTGPTAQRIPSQR